MLIENIMPANEEKVWYYLFMCGLLTSVCVGCQTYGRSLFFSLVISVVIMVSFFFFFFFGRQENLILRSLFSFIVMLCSQNWGLDLLMMGKFVYLMNYLLDCVLAVCCL